MGVKFEIDFDVLSQFNGSKKVKSSKLVKMIKISENSPQILLSHIKHLEQIKKTLSLHLGNQIIKLKVNLSGQKRKNYKNDLKLPPNIILGPMNNLIKFWNKLKTSFTSESNLRLILRFKVNLLGQKR